jgi:cell division transport system permease protein
MLPYSIKEGFAGLKRSRFSSIASTSAMSIALVLIGMFAIVSFQANTVSDWLKQRVGELELFIEDIDPASTNALLARTEITPGVSEATYVSKQEAEEIFRAEFGDEAELFFDAAFLPASIKVKISPDYANADSLEVLAVEFASWNRVDDVIYNQSLLRKVQDNLSLITILGVSLGLLVLFASTFLVANTIRLTIYARRLMIRTMKLVGATDSFIRSPFIVEGVSQGVIASIFAIFILTTLYGTVQSYIPQMSAISSGMGIILGVSELLFGVFLGWAGSFFAVRRFIKKISLN